MIGDPPENFEELKTLSTVIKNVLKKYVNINRGQSNLAEISSALRDINCPTLADCMDTCISEVDSGVHDCYETSVMKETVSLNLPLLPLGEQHIQFSGSPIQVRLTFRYESTLTRLTVCSQIAIRYTPYVA